MQISVGNLGAVIGTQLYRTETAPRYFLGHSFALAYMVANLVVVMTLYLVLKWENRKKDNAAGSEEVDPAGPWLGDEDKRWRFLL